MKGGVAVHCRFCASSIATQSSDGAKLGRMLWRGVVVSEIPDGSEVSSTQAKCNQELMWPASNNVYFVIQIQLSRVASNSTVMPKPVSPSEPKAERQSTTTMTSIGELFPKCRKLAYDARQQLALQQNTGKSNLGLVLEELNRQLSTMDTLVLRETPASRTSWKRKIAELRKEAASLEKHQAVVTSHYQSERDELLRRRHRNQGNISDMQNLASESESLEKSHVAVMDLVQTAEASYESLREQRQRLRGVTRVVADMGNALGLTQTTMKIIERRDITDAYLVAACMVVTLIVLYVTWFM